MMERRPMIMVREGAGGGGGTSPGRSTAGSEGAGDRRKLLQEYVNSGALIDPITIDIDAASKPFLDLHQDAIPPGFADWEEFGAPDSTAKINTRTSLSRRQHELIGWMLSIHFLTAAELAVAHLTGLATFDDEDRDPLWKNHRLPPPQLQEQDPLLDGQPSMASSMMHGVTLKNEGSKSDTTGVTGDGAPLWYMNPIHCRTSFEPTVGGSLIDSIVTGTVPETVNLIFPKSPSMYNSGWVLDLGPDAKTMQRLLQQYDLGYLYSTAAYYGVPPSGALMLFLPYEETESVPPYKLEMEGGDKLKEGEEEEGTGIGTRKRRDDVNVESPRPDSMHFLNIVICGANDNLGDEQCNMEKNLDFIIGGEKATDVHYINAMGVSDKGKPICVTMTVPTNATYTTKESMKKNVEGTEIEKKEKDSKAIKFQSPTKNKLGDAHLKADNIDGTFGISLKILVKGKIFWKTGRCSVSHVIWEQTRTES